MEFSLRHKIFAHQEGILLSGVNNIECFPNVTYSSIPPRIEKAMLPALPLKKEKTWSGGLVGWSVV